MDIVLRILVGLLLLGFVGWFAYFLFGIIELVLNGSAFLVGRGIRRALRLHGTQVGGATFGTTLIGLGKGVYGMALFAAIGIAAFLYPLEGWSQEAFNWALLITFASLILVWTPGVLLWGVFLSTEPEAAVPPERYPWDG